MKDFVIYARSWISALSFTLRQTRQRTVCIATLRTSHHKIQPFQRVSGFELMFSKNQFGQLWHDTNRKHNIWWCKVILFNFNIKKTLICLIFLIVQDSLRDQAGLPCARGTRQSLCLCKVIWWYKVIFFLADHEYERAYLSWANLFKRSLEITIVWQVEPPH